MRKREGLAALLAAEGQPSWRSGPVQFSPVPGKLAFGQSGRSKPLKPEQPGSRSAHGFLQRAYLSIRCGLLPGVKICRILSKIVPRARPRVNVETGLRDYFWHRTEYLLSRYRARLQTQTRQ